MTSAVKSAPTFPYASSSNYITYFSTTYGFDNAYKYLTIYSYGTTYYTQVAWNRSRLGDATGEIVTKYNIYYSSWDSDYSYFPYSTNFWFIRGAIPLMRLMLVFFISVTIKVMLAVTIPLAFLEKQ